MENLDQNVTDVAVEALVGPVCPIKKAIPVLVPVVAVLGLGVLVRKLWKNRKAKKAVDVPETEEVNPEN